MSRLLSRARGDKGWSLIELLVGMSIFSVLMGMVFTVLISTQKQVAGAGVRLDDIDQGRMALDVLSRTLRTAVEPAQLQVFCTTCGGTAAASTAITDAQVNTITLYSNTDSTAGPNFVTFTVAYNATLKLTTLTKTSQPPDAGSAPNFVYTPCTPGPGCSKTVLTLIRGVVLPPTGTPPSFFQYFDNKGVELIPPTGASLPSNQLITIDSVGINMTVNTPNNFKAGPTTIYSRVGLPNSGTGVLVTPAATA